MEKKFNWKGGLFKSSFRLYSGDTQVGKLTENPWSGSAAGEMNGKQVSFRLKGFFRQKTLIMELPNNELIGEVDFNALMTKATIRIHDRAFKWKYDNWLNTRWSISDTEGPVIQYSGLSHKGKISAKSDEDALILTGLFVINYYWQAMVVLLVAVLLPVWIVLVN